MTAQEYIREQLNKLKQPAKVEKPKDKEALIETIYGLLMSKKFRKYSANEDLQKYIKNAVRVNVEKNEPINVTFLHGAYKLWRLKESPEVDWAELFALMYYTRWVKPICEIYKPGVWFDFFVDDYIIPILNNVPISDVTDYLKSYKQLLDFLKDYQPKNLRMSITRVGDQFDSEEAFNQSLRSNIDKLDNELPTLTPEQSAMVELNTRQTEEQDADPKWREKVYLVHNAYSVTKAEPQYHKGRPEKILAFTQPLPSGTTISVGTTKDSIMKFWIGVGVLRPHGGSYRQVILSPSQLGKVNFHLEDLSIPRLNGHNFKQIRVLNI